LKNKMNHFVENKKSTFDYGETVKISGNTPERYHPAEIGFVC